jgi:2-amino-4-hydroxy-6-hydroxymethyldihydropteridine diphosphokinase
MNEVYLQLGSNIGNSKKQLLIAQDLLTQRIGFQVAASSLYQTAAWGNTDQADFINQVIIIKSPLAATDCLQKILAIEQEMGRVRTQKNAPRIIDIDILFFNNDIINCKDLVVPHPALPDRRFVLIPLNELSPDFMHPVLKQTVHQMLLNCQDTLDVKKI